MLTIFEQQTFSFSMYMYSVTILYKDFFVFLEGADYILHGTEADCHQVSCRNSNVLALSIQASKSQLLILHMSANALGLAERSSIPFLSVSNTATLGDLSKSGRKAYNEFVLQQLP